MPRVVKLNELAGYSDGEILPMVRGKLTKLYDGKTKNGRYGEYVLQNAELTADGVTVPLFMMLDKELPKSWKDKEISIQAHDGEKGLAGVEASDNTYQGKTTRQIKVTGKAEFALLSGSQDRGSEDRPPRDDHPPRENAPQDRPPAQNQPSNGGSRGASTPGSPQAINDVKKMLVQRGNLLLLAAVYIENVLAPAFKDETGKDLDEARKGGWATSLAIALEKKGAEHLMPVKPMRIKPAVPPRPSQQSQPPHDIPRDPGHDEDDIPF